jgi:hypothetical protein
MSDPEQPGSKRRRLLQILQHHESPDERVLHDVLAVDDRSHETRTVAVQIGPQLAGKSEEFRPAVMVQRGSSRAQAAAASSIVTPVSPLSPKAKPLAYVGSSSTETTFSPNSRGGIGAPKRATTAEARALNNGLSKDLEIRRRHRSRARHSLRPHKLVVPLADRSRAGVAKVVQVDPIRLASAQCRNRRDDCYRERDRPDLERNVC